MDDRISIFRENTRVYELRLMVKNNIIGLVLNSFSPKTIVEYKYIGQVVHFAELFFYLPDKRYLRIDPLLNSRYEVW